VGCRSTDAKAALVRVARTPAGVVIDRRGTAPGRGAYVHPVAACVEAAIARHAFGRALGTDPPQDEVGRLRTMIEGDA
jgi:predicted RNA-binding protein YlxR (DUF448 family)